jgi:hypothetical protein
MVGVTSTMVPAEVKTLAVIARIDTAFRNLELPFILKSYLFRYTATGMRPQGATFAVLPAFSLQASELVKFYLLRFNAWPIGHLSIETR